MRASDLELLRRTALCRAIGDDATNRLVRGAFVQALPKGATLFTEGDEAEFVHVLLKGRVCLSAAGPDGESTVVEIFPEGELFVVAAAILRLPYLVTARLATDARVLMIPVEDFRLALAGEPRLAQALLEVMARHWRLLVTQIKDLKLRPAARRLAGGLVDLADSDAGPATVRLDMDRKLLAQRLGMTPESLSRAFAALRPLGVASQGRTIRVERVEALRDYCDPARLS